MEQIDELIEISEYLKNNAITDQLKRIKLSYEEKRCQLTFMGQFSAGKSCLINHLLGRSVLPVHISETTAVLTNIMYDDEENAVIFYQDGGYETISIEDSLKFWQSGEYHQKLANISYINIFLKNDLLKSGLRIVDTPGINTIIESHVEITKNLIKQSDRIVYVMGKSLTETDEDFINRILNDGLEILFVRTHMDELKDSEEDAQETVKLQKELLSRLSDDEVFFVSNIETSPYYKELLKLRDYIQVTLTDSIEEAIAHNLSKLTEFISQKLSVQLLDKRIILEQLLNGRKNEYLESKNQIEFALERMRAILKSNKDSMKRKYDSHLKNADSELEISKEIEIKSVQKTIAELNIEPEPNLWKPKMENCVKQSCISLQKGYISYFEKILEDNNAFIEKELQESAEFLNINIDLPDNLDECVEQTENLKNKVMALNVLKNELEDELAQLENESSKNSLTQQALENEYNEINKALASVRQELDEYPEYKEQYIIKEGNHTHEENWRKVGEIADWITIILPGKTWTKAGEKILKLGSKGAKILKATNAADKLSKGAKVLSESAKIAQGIDIVSDGAKLGKKFGKSKKVAREQAEIENMAKNLNSTYQYLKEKIDSTEKKPSFLDYISIDYYFSKIGKAFDTPDTIVVDEEYKIKYEREKNEILSRFQQKTTSEIKKRAELLGIRNSQEELALKQSINRKNQKKADDELLALQSEIEKEKYKAKLSNIRKFYFELCAEKINDFCGHIKSKIKQDIMKNMEEYIESYDYSIIHNIRKKNEELSNLEVNWNSGNYEEIKKELDLCKEYSKKLSPQS